MWFGEPWPSAEERAPVCEDDAQRVETPVGSDCLFCDDQVAEGDRGTLTMALIPGPGGPRWSLEPVHAECGLRNVLGGAGHLAGMHPDCDGGLSRRVSALLVAEWVDEMGVENVLGAARFPRVAEELQDRIAARGGTPRGPRSA
jgi:hypothetical protein